VQPLTDKVYTVFEQMLHEKKKREEVHASSWICTHVIKRININVNSWYSRGFWTIADVTPVNLSMSHKSHKQHISFYCKCLLDDKLWLAVLSLSVPLFLSLFPTAFLRPAYFCGNYKLGPVKTPMERLRTAAMGFLTG